MKCGHGEEHRCRFTFSTGETIESCGVRGCEHGVVNRRAVLCPKFKFVEDREPRELKYEKPLKPASTSTIFAALNLVACEGPNVAESDEQIAAEKEAAIEQELESSDEPDRLDGDNEDAYAVEELEEEEEYAEI